MTRLPRTFRGRLALAYSALLAFILTGFGFAIYVVVHVQLTRHHDQELLETAGQIEAIVGQHEDCEHLTPEQVAELNSHSKLVLFHSVGGNPAVFYRSPDLASLTVARDLAARPQFLEERSAFRTYVEKGGYIRVYTRPYRSRAGRQGVIRVMERMGDVERPLANLRVALLLLVPLAIAGSVGVSFSLARRALAPVVEVTALAREIESTQLSRRLPRRPVPDEIGSLVDTFNQMIGRLETSFEAMKRFTGDASHELRSPLANMQSTIDVTLSRPREVSEYQDALTSIGEEVSHLRRIVADLLLLARADGGRVPFQLEPVRLDVIAAETAESFAERATSSGVGLRTRCAAGVLVLGDERWLRQLVANLLENAIRFSATGAEATSSTGVTISVSASGNVAILTVDDTGPGIPEADLGRVFERFYRVDGARPRTADGGAGLGLAICAWIISEHGGSISAAQGPEGGTRITVTIPLTGAPGLKRSQVTAS